MNLAFLNFLFLFLWLAGFFIMDAVRPTTTEGGANGRALQWCAGLVIFLGMGIWLTLRA